MIKLVLLIRKKQGMSDDAFKNHYENVHAVLASKTLPQIIHYRRNYLRADVSRSADGEVICTRPDSPDFDVMTEQCFQDRSSFDEAMRILSNHEAGRRIADDEENLFDRSSIRAFLVDDCTSTL
jgi:hypothetical protein